MESFQFWGEIDNKDTGEVRRVDLLFLCSSESDGLESNRESRESCYMMVTCNDMSPLRRMGLDDSVKGH